MVAGQRSMSRIKTFRIKTFSGIVRDLSGDAKCRQRLVSLGFTPGALIQVLRTGNGGPMLVSIQGSRVALGFDEAGLVEVGEAPAEPSPGDVARQKPVILALNMMDVAEEEGLIIEPKVLETAIGITVIPIEAAKSQGVAELLEAIFQIVSDTGLQFSSHCYRLFVPNAHA